MDVSPPSSLTRHQCPAGKVAESAPGSIAKWKVDSLKYMGIPGIGQASTGRLHRTSFFRVSGGQEQPW